MTVDPKPAEMSNSNEFAIKTLTTWLLNVSFPRLWAREEDVPCEVNRNFPSGRKKSRSCS